MHHWVRDQWRSGALLGVLLLVGPALARASTPSPAQSLHGRFSFDPDELSWGSLNGYDMPILTGALPSGPSGYPELPERSQSFAIPDGFRVVELRVDHAEREVDPVRRRIVPVRTQGEGGSEACWEAPAAYGAAGEYPGRAVELAGVGSWRGRRVADVVYHPVGWDPATREVTLYRRVDFTLVLAPEAPGATPAVKPLREFPGSRRAAERLLNAHVVNAAALLEEDADSAGTASYTPFRPSEYPSLDGSLVEYVIITTDALASAWQAWADAKTQRGVPALVRTTTWIEANYHGGTDLAENIRLFIRDAYQKWGTRYVLLGGDTNLIPTRYAYIHYYALPQGEEIPTDLYYSCLDGSWDGNGNGIYGEGYDALSLSPGDSIDLYPEVSVGRAPVRTSSDVSIFINKTRNYRSTPSGTTNWTTAAFMAEVLFPNPWPQGPDSTIYLNGCDIVQDCINHVAAPWTVFKLCEYPDGNMNWTAVRNALNAGYGLVSIVTHGDAFKLDTSDNQYFRLADMQALTNVNKCGVYYYSNCGTGQFDSECLNEAAMLNSSGACVAAIAPSRLEFPQVSRFYMEEYYRDIFTNATDGLGELNDFHKVRFVPSTGSDNAYRWVHFAGNLLGDPELHIWRSVPDSMTFSGGGASMSVSDTTYTLTITHAGSPVSGAQVTMWNGTTKDYASGLTNASGVIVLNYRPSATGTVTLTATHSLYKTRTRTITVSAGTEARIAVQDVIIDDDNSGLSSGNGDHVPDAGERIELGVKLKNAGTVSVSSVNGTLSLASGASLTLTLTENGTPMPLRTFLGQSAANPVSLPATLSLTGTSPSLFGRPYYTAMAEPDTGAYLWQDLAGCHLRFMGARHFITFAGSITTDGAMLTARPYRLEGADAISTTSTALNFTVAVDSIDWEDGVDFVVADSSYATILNGLGSYGTMAAGDTLTRFCLVQTSPASPDRHSVRMPFTVTGTTTSSRTWSEGLRLELEAPDVGEEYHALDDSTDGGNRNGRFDTGETVRLNAFVHNEGHGQASGVQGTLRPVSGVTVLDSVVSFGNIPAAGLVSGGTRFRLTGTGATKIASLELRDSYGRTWTKQINLSVPDAPGVPVPGPVIPQVSRAIDLLWTPPAAANIAGYNVYRANNGSTTFTRVNGALIDQSALYHDVSVQNESTYVYKVAAVDSAGNEGPRSGTVTTTAPPPYLGTFPKTLNGAIWSSPVLMDLGEDSSGDLEIIVGSEDGYLYVFNPDGSTRTGWPKFCGDEIWSSPAVGNLDAISQPEIVVGANSRRLYAFHYNGTGLTSSDGLFTTVSSEIRSTPTLADLDGNGTLEIIFGTMDGKVYAWEGNHTPYLADSLFANPGGSIAASPTVADIDGDGHPEVLVPDLNGKLYCYKYNGTPYLSGNPVFYSANGGLWASVAVGDADGDGQQDIFGASYAGSVYRWNKLGVVQTGWPKNTGGEIWGSPALGDLNGDGKLECVIGSSDYKAHAYQWNGAELGGWPFTAQDSIWSSPVLADISGDGHPDVIFESMDSHLYALKHDGTPVPGWPILFTDRCFGSAAAVGDVDRDGRVDVVAGGYEGRLYAWSIGKPWNPSPSASPWPMFCHDTYRTGWFNRPLTGVEGGGVAPPPAVTALAQNEPNPFNPRTTIRFDLAHDGPVTLSVFDVVGRRVRTLAAGPHTAGRYSVRWDGVDDRGHAVASGVYFYRLEADAVSLDRKMILVR